MSTVSLTENTLEVRLSRLEKIGALQGDLRIPREAIRAAEVVPDGLAATRGLRAPGLGIPGFVKLGTWRGRRNRGDRQFITVRRGLPALRLTLDGQPNDMVLVSTPRAAELAADLGANRPTG